MGFEFKNLTALETAGFDDIIDVRSPSEFAEDHVPGSINLPVLSDAERAEVGTIYVQDSPFKARKLGAALVAQNAARHLQGPLADREGGWRPLVYCWRGGQRSGSFASILSQIGWRAEVIQGGYRSYRRQVVKSLYDDAFPAPVVLLDGDTGTAKTEVLAGLAAYGVQSVDLEAMANHRGSAFGAMGAQPSQKAFESHLAAALSNLDPSRPVVIEAESSRIGRINLPPKLFAAMRNAPRVFIRAPISDRARYLCRAYSDLLNDNDALVQSLKRLVRVQGHQKVETWTSLARDGEYRVLAEDLIREHYDPRYSKVRGDQAENAKIVDADTLDIGGVSALTGKVADAVRSF